MKEYPFFPFPFAFPLHNSSSKVHRLAEQQTKLRKTKRLYYLKQSWSDTLASTNMIDTKFSGIRIPAKQKQEANAFQLWLFSCLFESHRRVLYLNAFCRRGKSNTDISVSTSPKALVYKHAIRFSFLDLRRGPWSFCCWVVSRFTNLSKASFIHQCWQTSLASSTLIQILCLRFFSGQKSNCSWTSKGNM